MYSGEATQPFASRWRIYSERKYFAPLFTLKAESGAGMEPGQPALKASAELLGFFWWNIIRVYINCGFRLQLYDMNPTSNLIYI